MPRGTAQIDDVSTWLPPSLDTPWQNVFLNISITRQSEKLEFQKKKKKKKGFRLMIERKCWFWCDHRSEKNSILKQ